MDAAGVVGVLGCAFGAVQMRQMAASVRQVADPSGVSRPTWLILLGQGVGWATFGVAERLWPSMAINVLVLVVALVVLRRLLTPARYVAALAGTAALAVVAVAVVAAGHSGLVGWFAGTCSLVAFFPQAATLLRTRDTAGLSLSSWALALASVSCWIVYGVAKGSPQIVASSIPPAVCAVLIAGALLRSRAAAVGTLGA